MHFTAGFENELIHMISILVCSIRSDLKEKLAINIRKTIGVEFELTFFDNSKEDLPITTVYNKLASAANYDFLCFVHEDVLFHTINWGNNLLKHIQQEDVSLVGVAGSIFKSRYPSAWWFGGNTLWKQSIIQHNAEGKVIMEQGFSSDKRSEEVVVVDGVFLCTRKSLWEKNKFDEILLRGFHNYDIDFSLSLAKEGRVLVVNDILLEHFSSGSYNKDWIKSSEAIAHKWAHQLPLELSGGQINLHKAEMEGYLQLMDILIANKIPFLILVRYALLFLLHFRSFSALKKVIRSL